MISYAQNFEDVILARALDDRANGFYVDIGACYPDVASVTRHFYERGWNGVNVEPMSEPFERLQAGRPRDVNMRAAVASFTGHIPIYQGQSVGESSALRPFDTARPIVVPCFTLAEVCRRYVSQPIDFLKIDVEGLELDVVKSGDWAQYRPAVVLVEVTMPWSTQRRPDAHDIVEFLRGKDYDEVYFDGLNAFFLAREAASLTPRLAVPPNVLDRFTVAREADLEAATARLQAHAESVGRRLAEVETHAGAAERESAALTARAIAAEALAQQSERANTELRDALSEKESLLVNAQRAWQDAVAIVARLQADVAKATSELQSAELRAGELAHATAEAEQRAESAARDAGAALESARAAEVRAQAAEGRSKDAEDRLREAETKARAAEAKSLQEIMRAQQALADAAQSEIRAGQAEARAEQADARAQHAEIRARQADARARQAEALTLRAEAIATDLEARRRELEAREHRSVARALQAEDTIASMLRSRSWRITAPLRVVADLIRGGPRGASAPVAPARRGRFEGAPANALRRARSLARRTGLYHWAAPRVKQRYPKLWMRARSLVLDNPAPTRVPKPPPPVAGHAAESTVVRPPDTMTDTIPMDLTIEELTSRIQREVMRRRPR